MANTSQMKGCGRGRKLNEYLRKLESTVSSTPKFCTLSPVTDEVNSHSDNSESCLSENRAFLPKVPFDEILLSDDESTSGDSSKRKYTSDDLTALSLYSKRPDLTEVKTGVKSQNEKECYDENPIHDDISELECKENVRQFNHEGSDFSDYILKKMVTKLENTCGIIHGNIDCKPISDIFELELNDKIYSVLNRKNIKDLTRCQMYAIPILLQRRNLILIGPPESGKTFGCVISFMSLLLNENDYNEVQLGNGPRCVFITTNSQNVRNIGNLCQTISHGLKVVTAHGCGLEKERYSELTNGCEVLVTTPRCWLRLLQNPIVTNVNRLCHIILDNSDILFSTFKKEIKTIFLCVDKLLKKRKETNCSLGVNVAVVGEKWTPAHDECLLVIESPVVSIISNLEAALYSRIKPIARIVASGGKLKKLLELLEKSKDFKTVIICRTSEDVITLKPHLHYPPDHVLVVHEEMRGLPSIQTVKDKWIKSSGAKILLCCDAVLGELAITDAQHLIHFSLPINKSFFSERFSTIQDYFIDRVKNPKETEASCWVNILIDNTNISQFPEIIAFLERLKMPIPTNVKELIKVMKNEKEISKAALPLCEDVLMFGTCHKISKCPHRHVFFSEVDSARKITRSGFYKMKVLYIHNPSHYSVRIIGSKLQDKEPWCDFKTNFGTISFKMANYYSKRNNRVSHGKANVGDLVAVEVEVESMFKRGIVTKILSTDEKQNPVKLSVRLIDEGSIKECDVLELIHLPQQLQIYDPEAYDVYIAGVCPPDSDPQWSYSSIIMIREGLQNAVKNVEDYFFVAKVVLSVGSNLITNSFVCHEWLERNRCYRFLFSPRNFIIESNLGEINNKHLPALMDMAEAANLILETEPEQKPVDINEMSSKQKPVDDINGMSLKQKPVDGINEMSLQQKQVDVINKMILKQKPVDGIKEMSLQRKPEPILWAYLEEDYFKMTYVSYLESPSLFYLHIRNNSDELTLLEEELNKILNVEILKPGNIMEDMICASKNPGNNEWNRALVIDVQNEEAYVLFVDHGDVHAVPFIEISLLPKGFLSRLPLQGIECSLVGIKKDLESDWSPESIDFFESLVNNEAGDRKDLYAKVCEIKTSETTKDKHYQVLLIESNESEDVLLNKKLIVNGYANWATDSTKRYLIDGSYTTLIKEECRISNVEIDLNNDNNESSIIDSASSDESDEVWTEEKCVDPKRLKASREIISTEDETSSDPNDIINILQNGDFDFECNLEGLKTLSKDVVDYLPSPLQTLLNGEKNPKAIEYSPLGESSDGSKKTIAKEDKEDTTPMLNDLNDSIKDVEEETENGVTIQQSDSHELIVLSVLVRSPIIEETTGIKLQILNPTLTWSQTDFKLTISVMLPDIKEYFVYSCYQQVFFMCRLEEKVYPFDLKLFGPVNKDSVRYSPLGQRFDISMEKIVPGSWPRLVYESNMQGPWIKADASSLITKETDTIEFLLQRGETNKETREEYEGRMELRKQIALNPLLIGPDMSSSDSENSNPPSPTHSDAEEYDNF